MTSAPITFGDGALRGWQQPHSVKDVIQPDPIDLLLSRHLPRYVFRHGDREITLACFVRQGDWRPLRAEWWRGKDVSVIAVDSEGNFFLRHSDGGVRYWDHQLQTDVVIAGSVKDFAQEVARASALPERTAHDLSKAPQILPE